MPYARCRSCGLRSYVAGGHAERPRCPRCDEPLVLTSLTASPDGPSRFRRTLARDADAPQAARQALRRIARVLDRDSSETAQLLVSELVTNAVKHGSELGNGGGLALAGFLDEERLYVEVSDGGTGFEPRPGEPGVVRTSGWGLVLVDQLADGWGVTNESDVRVWFELRRRSANGAGVAG